MTLIIAAEGNNFVVLAADGKGTWVDAGGSRMESITEEKLVPLTKYACALIAGDPELGVQLVEEFKTKNKYSYKWGISQVVSEFSNFCKKTISQITDTIRPNDDAFPVVIFLIGGLDKTGRKYVPKLNILRSERLFLPGRQKNKAAEGKPFIARYLFSKKYDKDLSKEVMGFLVAEAMRETISIDGDVGGKVRMAIIDENGCRVLSDEVVKRYLDGPEEDEIIRLEEERKGLEKLLRE